MQFDFCKDQTTYYAVYHKKNSYLPFYKRKKILLLDPILQIIKFQIKNDVDAEKKILLCGCRFLLHTQVESQNVIQHIATDNDDILITFQVPKKYI